MNGIRKVNEAAPAASAPTRNQINIMIKEKRMEWESEN
jgi:hypothetical protein